MSHDFVETAAHPLTECRFFCKRALAGQGSPLDETSGLSRCEIPVFIGLLV